MSRNIEYFFSLLAYDLPTLREDLIEQDIYEIAEIDSELTPSCLHVKANSKEGEFEKNIFFFEHGTVIKARDLLLFRKFGH